MLMLAMAIATMPRPIGSPLPGDLGLLASLMNETRPSATRIEVTVDQTGQPVRCEVVVSHGMTALDRAACEQSMRRGRFAPALDSTGLPIAAVVRLDFTVNRIAALRRANSPAATAREVDFAVPVAGLTRTGDVPDVPVTDVVLTTDPAGRVSRCDVAVSSNRAPLDRLACGQLMQTVFRPALDRAGQPVAALRQVSVAFSSETIAR